MLLELKNIVKHYDLPHGNTPLTVLNGITLTIEQGEAIAVVGPSGSGKSTLLNIIGALDKPTSGSVSLHGKNLADIGDNELAAIRNNECGFIFQLHHLLPQCTVLENVLIPSIPNKSAHGKDIRDRAIELLHKVGLENHLTYFPAQLSGGERQRVAVVRALINSPGLLLADEPTGSLDKASAHDLGQLLLDLNRTEKVTLLVVTHSLELANRMDTVYSLENGVLELSE